MKRFYFFLIFFACLNSQDDDFGFNLIGAEEDDFEMVINQLDQDKYDLSYTIYNIKRMPCAAQIRIIRPFIGSMAPNELWNAIVGIDRVFQENMKEIDNTSNKRKNIKLYDLKVEYKRFLFSAFDHILSYYNNKIYTKFFHDVFSLNRLSSYGKDCFNQTIYSRWPYLLNKYTTIFIAHEVFNDSKFNELDYLLKGYDSCQSDNGLFFSRPLYKNFETPAHVFVSVLAALFFNKEWKNFSDKYRNYLKHFFNIQTFETFTITSLELRQHIESLFLRLDVSARG